MYARGAVAFQVQNRELTGRDLSHLPGVKKEVKWQWQEKHLLGGS